MNRWTNLLLFFVLSLFFVENIFCSVSPRSEDSLLYLSPIDQNKILALAKQNIDTRYCQNEWLIGQLSSFQYNDHPIYPIPFHGFFVVDHDDDLIKNTQEEERNLESNIIKLIKKHALNGSTVVEIGTNLGIHTLSLSKTVGENGKVIAFEPNPKLFSKLFMTLEINNVKNTKLFVTTNENSELNENSNFSFDQINVDSLDLENVSLIKINTEGKEEIILNGMKQTLEKQRPIILLKIAKGNDYETANQDIKDYISSIKEKLQSMNFEVIKVHSDDYIAYPKEEKEVNKKVLLAILAKNKAHVLQAYLKCIEKLDYDKKLIGIYVNTYNNIDNTKKILKEWIEKNKNDYRFIYYENCESNENLSDYSKKSPVEEFKLLGKIRNKSLKKTKHFGCDYYFVVDCENFITPSTLKDLIQEDKPIIAPMLTSIPVKNDAYSNYFYSILENGYYLDHPDYYKILNRSIIGTLKVPVVHCTYLIKASYLDKLNYIDETNHHEFIVFSRCARSNNIDQYICNEKQFGYILHFENESICLTCLLFCFVN